VHPFGADGDPPKLSDIVARSDAPFESLKTAVKVRFKPVPLLGLTDTAASETPAPEVVHVPNKDHRLVAPLLFCAIPYMFLVPVNPELKVTAKGTVRLAPDIFTAPPVPATVHWLFDKVEASPGCNTPGTVPELESFNNRKPLLVL
jgi:hypothetical protein